MTNSFVRWTEERGLIDLNFISPRYTWNHDTKVETKKSARFDKAMSNQNWRSSFLKATIKPLPRSYSDHCLIMLQTSKEVLSFMCKRPFRFQATWLEHREFGKIVEQCWQNISQLPPALERLSDKLSFWNKESFGNIFQKKRYQKLAWRECKNL